MERLFTWYQVGSSYAAVGAVVVLVLLKTALDLGFHLAEHRAASGNAVVPLAGTGAAP